MTQTAPTRPSLSRGLRFYIVLSTLLNVIFISFFAVAVLHFTDDDDDKHSRRPDLFSHLIRSLDDDEKRTLFRQMREHGRDTHDDRPKVHLDIATLLTADPFDPEAVRRALRDHKAQLVGKNDIAIESYVEVLSTMTQAERSAYAAKVQDRMQKARDRRRDTSHD